MNEIVKPFWEKAKICYELKELERLGLTPDLEQREMILSFLSLILKHNEKLNIVTHKEDESLFLRYFCDSIQPLLLFGFKKNASVFDIESGGGFPSIPIIIFRPDLSFELSESDERKVEFLREVKSVLGIENLIIHNNSIENLKTKIEKFDYVISRGVGSLIKVSQLAKPFVLDDGRIYTFKTKQFEMELSEITMNKDRDGIGISEIAEYDLGNQVSGLNLVSLELIK